MKWRRRWGGWSGRGQYLHPDATVARGKVDSGQNVIGRFPQLDVRVVLFVVLTPSLHHRTKGRVSALGSAVGPMIWGIPGVHLGMAAPLHSVKEGSSPVGEQESESEGACGRGREVDTEMEMGRGWRAAVAHLCQRNIEQPCRFIEVELGSLDRVVGEPCVDLELIDRGRCSDTGRWSSW